METKNTTPQTGAENPFNSFTTVMLNVGYLGRLIDLISAFTASVGAMMLFSYDVLFAIAALLSIPIAIANIIFYHRFVGNISLRTFRNYAIFTAVAFVWGIAIWTLSDFDIKSFQSVLAPPLTLGFIALLLCLRKNGKSAWKVMREAEQNQEQ